LICTPINYTSFNLSEHLDHVSHDVVSNFMKQSRIMASIRHHRQTEKSILRSNYSSWSPQTATLTGSSLMNVNLPAQIAQYANDVRWQVEEFHRELKQLAGSQKCQRPRPLSTQSHRLLLPRADFLKSKRMP